MSEEIYEDDLIKAIEKKNRLVVLFPDYEFKSSYCLYF